MHKLHTCSTPINVSWKLSILKTAKLWKKLQMSCRLSERKFFSGIPHMTLSWETVKWLEQEIKIQGFPFDQISKKKWNSCLQNLPYWKKRQNLTFHVRTVRFHGRNDKTSLTLKCRKLNTQRICFCSYLKFYFCKSLISTLDFWHFQV